MKKDLGISVDKFHEFVDNNSMTKRKPRVVNLYGGPGTGKSIAAAGTFAIAKLLGANTELITEYAKDATWEQRSEKLFKSQEYIFGKQHFRVSRVADQVDFVITDSPILMGAVYMPPDFPMPSLRQTIYEAQDNYDSINILLKRSGAYQQDGRSQSLAEAEEKDRQIEALLIDRGVEYTTIKFDRKTPFRIINILRDRGWIKT